MCLLVFAHNAHPRYPLVVVANRDEYHDREAESAHWWLDPPGLLAGRDLRAGGTWMGVAAGGRWGALTNYRDGPPAAAPRSRGELVVDYLRGDSAPAVYLDNLKTRADDYGGFSLLVGDPDGIHCFSNRRGGVTRVEQGIHTLSNHLLDTPWPKSEMARLKLNRLLHKSRLEIEELLAVLADSDPFEDELLPVTGVGIEMERVLSPPFIKGETYGTRCTTVLLVENSGEGFFAEQVFFADGMQGGLSLFELPIPPVR